MTDPVVAEVVGDGCSLDIHPGRGKDPDPAGKWLVELGVKLADITDPGVRPPLSPEAVEPGHAVHEGGIEALLACEIRCVTDAELEVVRAPGLLDALYRDDFLSLVVRQAVVKPLEIPSSEYGREFALEGLQLGIFQPHGSSAPRSRPRSWWASA